MALVCRHCHRANPADAQYCFHDGLALANGQASITPVAVGAQPFLMPFVFPSGRSCNSFDEFVLAAYDLWDEARDLLKQGFFSGFLGGLGRADLARFAKQAEQSPDPDRSLDDLLAQLPSTKRQPAQLRIQPVEVNLGLITSRDKRSFQLHLENQGMGLLHGSIAAEDTPWLALGDGPSTPTKMFECRVETVIPVHVLPDRLRAGNKPVVGKLVVESSGGTQTVMVRAERTIVAFADGALAGAASPRQLAEKAKASPKQAVSFFETGAVARWYEENGWTYPIQGPQASGLASVQQFFEALGLTKPPRVDISEQHVRLTGRPGDALEHKLKVTTEENRPVYASATTSAAWLQIERIQYEGRTARIRLVVPNVPASSGENLLAKVQVLCNGGQRFVVAVALSVQGSPSKLRSTPGPVVVSLGEAVGAPTPVLRPAATEEIPIAVLEPALIEPFPIPPPPPPAPQMERGSWPEYALDNIPVVIAAAVPAPPPPPIFAPERVIVETPAAARNPQRLWPHLLPLAVVLLLLSLIVLHDVLLPSNPELPWCPPASPPPPTEEKLDPTKYIGLQFHDGRRFAQLATMPNGDRTMRFGVVMTKEKDPKRKDNPKQLTYDNWGRTGNTCLKIGGEQVLFGDPAGTWVFLNRPRGKDPATGLDIEGAESVWRYRDVEVTQIVEVVPGRQSRKFDTCLVWYVVANKGKAPAQVGLRFLLDTFIGANDGVPFTIPGQKGLCDTMLAFDDARSVPDFIEALERDDLANPGTVARLQFRLGQRLEPPTSVFLGGWPHRLLQKVGQGGANEGMTLWDVPRTSMREANERARDLVARGQLDRAQLNNIPPDSAVVLYWEPKWMKAGDRRELGFTYGLGNVVADKGGKLLLTVGGKFVPGGEFTLTALVSNPADGEQLTLAVPSGLELLPSSAARQPVPPIDVRAARRTTPVTWRVQAVKPGVYTMEVRSSRGASQKQTIRIYEPRKDATPGVFD